MTAMISWKCVVCGLALISVLDFGHHCFCLFPGTSVYLFNYLSGISVGAKQNKTRHLYDAFKGIIAGVYFNGVRVIDRYVKTKSSQFMNLVKNEKHEFAASFCNSLGNERSQMNISVPPEWQIPQKSFLTRKTA